MVNNFLQATQIMHLHDSNDLRASTLVLVEVILTRSLYLHLNRIRSSAGSRIFSILVLL